MQATARREVAVDFRPAEQAAMEREVLAAIRGGVPEVTLRLDHLETLEVSDLRALIVLLRRAREAGGALAIQTSKPQIRRILAVTALDRLFAIRADSEAA
jgi:anti-anti-sigma factor